jgi:two-component system, cell cycle sensor histidine kinase PleC
LQKIQAIPVSPTADDYEVFATSNAGHALELAAQHDIGVILCDERMPNVSGHEFLRQVRKISSATRVMMSGYADMSALTEAVNDGQIFAYIAKPWEPLGLKAQVRSAMVHFNLLREVDQERALVHALMEGIPDLIYFKDCELRFTRVNRAHARTLGAEDATKCVGQRDSDYFGSEDSLRWKRQEEEILSSGQAQVDCTERIRNPWGTISWMSTTKIPLFDRNGQVPGSPASRWILQY